jgi:nicotinamide riboside transporter PnuC
MKNIEKRISAIEARNKKVELDKAWETSWARRLSIGVLTYAVIVIYLTVINNNAPFINAAVPVVGFLLSTLVLRRIKEIWQKNREGNT